MRCSDGRRCPRHARRRRKAAYVRDACPSAPPELRQREQAGHEQRSVPPKRQIHCLRQLEKGFQPARPWFKAIEKGLVDAQIQPAGKRREGTLVVALVAAHQPVVSSAAVARRKAQRVPQPPPSPVPLSVSFTACNPLAKRLGLFA